MEESYGQKSYFSICCIEGLESIAGRSVERKNQKYRSQCFIPEGEEKVSAATFRMCQTENNTVWLTIKHVIKGFHKTKASRISWFLLINLINVGLQ